MGEYSIAIHILSRSYANISANFYLHEFSKTFMSTCNPFSIHIEDNISIYRLITLLFGIFICLSANGQSKWSDWEALYSDNRVKVEIQFKIYPDNCEPGDRSSKFRYRVTGSHASSSFVTWKMDYVACNGNLHYFQRSLDISPSVQQGIIESMDYQFNSKSVETPHYGSRRTTRPEEANEIKAVSHSKQPERISGTTNLGYGESTILKVVGGILGVDASWIWYEGSCDGRRIGSGPEWRVSPLETTEYFVRAEGRNNNTPCVSIRVVVDPNSYKPTSISSAEVVCEGNPAELVVQDGKLGSGASWVWYVAGCGRQEVARGSRITIYPDKTTEYFVRAEGTHNITDCVAKTIRVSGFSVSPESIFVSKASICKGDKVTMKVESRSSTSVPDWEWYANSCGGQYLGSGQSIQVNPDASTTYFVRDESGCSEAPCVSKTIKVAEPSKEPAYIYASPTRYSKGDEVSLNLVGGSLGRGAEWIWYENGCGSQKPIGKGSSITVKPGKQQEYFTRGEGPCNVTDCKSILLESSKTRQFHPYSKHEGFDNKKIHIGIGLGMETIIMSIEDADQDVVGLGLASELLFYPFYRDNFRWGFSGSFSIGTTPLWIIGGDRNEVDGTREENYLYSIAGIGSDILFTPDWSRIYFLLSYQNDFHTHDFERAVYNESGTVLREYDEFDEAIRKESMGAGLRLGPFRRGSSERGYHMDIVYNWSRDFAWSWSGFNWNYEAISNWQQSFTYNLWIESMFKVQLDVSWNSWMGGVVPNDPDNERSNFYRITLMYNRNAFK